VLLSVLALLVRSRKEGPVMEGLLPVSPVSEARLFCFNSNCTIYGIFEYKFEEWYTRSGVPLELIEPNVKRSEICQIVGWTCPTDSGWFVSGVDPKTNARRTFGQFKSDTILWCKSRANLRNT
jgi:hypothetical protein